MAIEIRPASDADWPAIDQVRRKSWFAAYTGILDADRIDRATAPGGHATARPPAYRSTLVATAPERQAAVGAAVVEARQVIGYAAFGPERTVPSAILPTMTAHSGGGEPDGAAPPPGPLTAAGLAGETGELYAIYLTPAWWSAGVGRALTDVVLAALRAAGYRRVVLWTLTANARARRFYEKAGFAPDGATNILVGLSEAPELRYARDI